MGYTKLFDSMWSGSLYGKLEASAVFMVILSLSDAEGVVDMTHEAIAGRTGWPLEFIREGIRQLEEPDPRSRTPDASGRRIIRLQEGRDWGWFITNHEKYREEMRSIERREYLRTAKRKERDTRRQQLSTTVNNSQHVNPSYADTATATEHKNQEMSGKPDLVRVFDHWKAIWNHPLAKLDYKRKRTIANALKLGYDAETLCLAIGGYKNSPHHCGQNDRHTVYDDICLLIRDAEHIDAGLRFHVEPLGPPQAAKRKAAITWRPPSDLPLLEKIP